MDAWRGALSEWVNQRASRKAAVKAGNALLDFARQRLNDRSTPEAVCRRDARISASFNAWVRGTPTDRGEILNLVSEFFGWYLDTHLSAPDDYGLRVRSPGHVNPVARRHKGPAPLESARDPLPNLRWGLEVAEKAIKLAERHVAEYKTKGLHPLATQ